MSRRNLPAHLWNRIAVQLSSPANLAALRGTSKESKRGAERQYQHRRRVTVLGRAYASATARTVRPLVAALRGEPPEDGFVAEQGNIRHHMDLKVGRYTMDVLHLVQPPMLHVRWLHLGPSGWPVDATIVATHWGNNTTFVDFRALGPGGVTVGRLVKAAVKAAFPQ